MFPAWGRPWPRTSLLSEMPTAVWLKTRSAAARCSAFGSQGLRAVPPAFCVSPTAGRTPWMPARSIRKATPSWTPWRPLIWTVRWKICMKDDAAAAAPDRPQALCNGGRRSADPGRISWRNCPSPDATPATPSKPLPLPRGSKKSRICRPGMQASGYRDQRDRVSALSWISGSIRTDSCTSANWRTVSSKTPRTWSR